MKLKDEEMVFVRKFDVQPVTVHTCRPTFLVFGSSSILNVLVVWSWREDRWLDFEGSVGCIDVSYSLLLECNNECTPSVCFTSSFLSLFACFLFSFFFLSLLLCFCCVVVGLLVNEGVD